MHSREIRASPNLSILIFVTSRGWIDESNRHILLIPHTSNSRNIVRAYRSAQQHIHPSHIGHAPTRMNHNIHTSAISIFVRLAEQPQPNRYIRRRMGLDKSNSFSNQPNQLSNKLARSVYHTNHMLGAPTI